MRNASLNAARWANMLKVYLPQGSMPNGMPSSFSSSFSLIDTAKGHKRLFFDRFRHAADEWQHGS